MILNAKKYGKPSFKLLSLITVQKFFRSLLLRCDSIERVRISLDKGAVKLCGKPMKVYNYKDIILKFPNEEIPFRTYAPSRRVDLPIVIYLHGGSWIGGSIETHDNVCRKICRYSESVVVSVGYRLAPEHPFPTAVIDIYKTILWIHKNAEKINGDKNKIAVVGDSAGGNLASAVSSLILKKRGPKIMCQVLIYPCLNIYETNSESWKALGEDIFLKKEDAEKFIAMYVPNKEERKNPYVSPLYSKKFDNYPPTLIITAEFDPLRDEGEQYFKILKQANVKVNHFMVKGVHHGFITMEKIFQETNETLMKISNYLKSNFK